MYRKAKIMIFYKWIYIYNYIRIYIQSLILYSKSHTQRLHMYHICTMYSIHIHIIIQITSLYKQFPNIILPRVVNPYVALIHPFLCIIVHSHISLYIILYHIRMHPCILMTQMYAHRCVHSYIYACIAQMYVSLCIRIHLFVQYVQNRCMDHYVYVFIFVQRMHMYPYVYLYILMHSIDLCIIMYTYAYHR